MEERTGMDIELEKESLPRRKSSDEFRVFLKSESGKKCIKEFFSGERHGTKCHATKFI